MTIVFGNSAVFFAPPKQADFDLLARMQYARQKWLHEGQP
jgi:hypothetical protein